MEQMWNSFRSFVGLPNTRHNSWQATRRDLAIFVLLVALDIALPYPVKAYALMITGGYVVAEFFTRYIDRWNSTLVDLMIRVIITLGVFVLAENFAPAFTIPQPYLLPMETAYLPTWPLALFAVVGTFLSYLSSFGVKVVRTRVHLSPADVIHAVQNRGRGNQPQAVTDEWERAQEGGN